MNTPLPSMDDIRARLQPLSMKQIELLAQKSGIGWTTIYKIKLGTTENPGIETLRKFMDHIEGVVADTAGA